MLRHGVQLDRRCRGTRAEPASLFSIAVDPGNATIAKGGDELIEARLRGFQSDSVELLVRSADSANWTRLPMTADSTGRYAFRLFDIGGKTQYAVEANGVRSTTYTIDVSNLPYVKRMDLQYRYPGVHAAASRTTSTAPATSRRSRARWCAFASRSTVPTHGRSRHRRRRRHAQARPDGGRPARWRCCASTEAGLL